MPGSPKKRARREQEARALQEARERARPPPPRQGENMRPHSAPRVPPAPAPRPRQPGEGTPYQIVRATVMLNGRAVPVEIGIPGKVLDQIQGDVDAGAPMWRIGVIKNIAVRADVPRRKETG